MRLKIKTPSEEDLYNFFLALNDEVLFNFTPFGKVNSLDIAKKVAETELAKPLKQQKNFGLYLGSLLIGYGFLRFFEKYEKRYTCTLGIVVRPDYMNKGYGKKLLQKMILWAKTHKFRKIWLTVYSDNLRAIKLYKKLGFEIEGIFMNDAFFKNRPRHVVSMALIFGKKLTKERETIFNALMKL